MTFDNGITFNHQNHRYMISFIIALSLSLMIINLPLSVNKNRITEERTLQLELYNPLSSPPPVETTKPVISESKPSITEIKSSEKMENINNQQTDVSAKPIVKNIQETPKKDTKPQIETLPSSGVILNSAYGTSKLQDLGDDFSAATSNPEDFKFKTVEQPQWNKVTKLIDEDVDKPLTEMDFYSPGIRGAGERFMEKITPTKRFTTKYGTKIDCALFLLMPVCSWK